MKAAVYYENGPPDVFKYEEVPDAAVYPGGVLIRVEAVSIEGGDTLSRLRNPLPVRPYIVGYQAAGTIVEVGEGVTDLKVGDKVVTTNANGSHAELRAVPARVAWRLPAGMDVKEGAVIPVPFGTADDCLFEFGRLKKGETVLIQAGASGVGVAAIQLAKRAGARVIATASSDERLEKLKPLGMDHGVNYKRENTVQAVRKITGGQGVDVVVDPVGSTLPDSMAVLGYRGRISLVGQAGRNPTQVDPWTLMEGNRSITGVYLGAEVATDRVHNNIQKLIDEVARGDLKAIIDRTFPLSEAAAAHAYIESREAVGRVLLIP